MENAESFGLAPSSDGPPGGMLAPRAHRDLKPRPRDADGQPVETQFVCGPVLPEQVPFDETDLAQTVALIAERRPDWASRIRDRYRRVLLPALEDVDRIRQEEDAALPGQIRHAEAHNGPIKAEIATVRVERDRVLVPLSDQLEASDGHLARAHGTAVAKFTAAGGVYDSRAPSDDSLPHPVPRSLEALAAELHLPWPLPERIVGALKWLAWGSAGIVGTVLGVNFGLAAHVFEVDNLARRALEVVVAGSVGLGLVGGAKLAVHALWCLAGEYFYLGRPWARFWAWMVTALLVTGLLLGADMAAQQQGLLSLATARLGLASLGDRSHPHTASTAGADTAVLWWLSLLTSLAFLCFTAAEGYLRGRHQAVSLILTQHREGDIEARRVAFRNDPAVKAARLAHGEVVEQGRQRGVILERIDKAAAPYDASVAGLERQMLPCRQELEEQWCQRLQDAVHDAFRAHDEVLRMVEEALADCHAPAAGRRQATSGRPW